VGGGSVIETLAVLWIKRKVRKLLMKKLAIEVFKGALRHSLTAFGLLFVNSGLAAQDDVNAAVGAVGILLGFAWSVFRKWRRL